MLVLSRKKNESIVINNDITVVVVEIRGDKVRLPRKVKRSTFANQKDKEIPRHKIYHLICVPLSSLRFLPLRPDLLAEVGNSTIDLRL